MISLISQLQKVQKIFFSSGFFLAWSRNKNCHWPLFPYFFSFGGRGTFWWMFHSKTDCNSWESIVYIVKRKSTKKSLVPIFDKTFNRFKSTHFKIVHHFSQSSNLKDSIMLCLASDNPARLTDKLSDKSSYL